MKLWRDVGEAIQGALDLAVAVDRYELSHWLVALRPGTAPVSPMYAPVLRAPTRPFPGSRLERWPAGFSGPPQ